MFLYEKYKKLLDETGKGLNTVTDMSVWNCGTAAPLAASYCSLFRLYSRVVHVLVQLMCEAIKCLSCFIYFHLFTTTAALSRAYMNKVYSSRNNKGP